MKSSGKLINLLINQFLYRRNDLCVGAESIVPSVIVGLSPGKCAPPQKWQLPCNAECFPLSTHTLPSVAWIRSSSSQPSWMMERRKGIGQTELKRVREKKDREKEKQWDRKEKRVAKKQEDKLRGEGKTFRDNVAEKNVSGVNGKEQGR